MSQRRFDPNRPTDRLYLGPIIDRSSCRRHNAAEGEPCFTIVKTDQPNTIGICNWRAVAAGVNHAIRPESMRQGAPRQSNQRRSNRR